MKKYYGIYGSLKEDRDFESKNGFFIAAILIGVSRSEEILNCVSPDRRYEMIKEKYEAQRESFTWCKRGAKYICALLKDKGIPIRKRKCMCYVFTGRGRFIYSDIAIIDFARTILQIVNFDPVLCKVLEEELVKDSIYEAMPGGVTTSECLAHLFGFQYEFLDRYVNGGRRAGETKKKRLSDWQDEMKKILENFQFPKRCHIQTKN